MMRLPGFRADQSCGRLFPSGWQPQAPCGDELFRRQRRIKPGISLGQARATCGGELVIVQPGVGQVSKSLEDDAVIELFGVANQQVAVCVLTMDIRCQAIRDVLDATAHLWRGEHFDERARGIGNRHFDGTAPQGF
jgi:hypothetical protein